MLWLGPFPCPQSLANYTVKTAMHNNKGHSDDRRLSCTVLREQSGLDEIVVVLECTSARVLNAMAVAEHKRGMSCCV